MQRVAIALCVVVAACTSTGRQDRQARSELVGLHISELEAQYGPPTAIAERLDGHLVYTWDRRETRRYIAPGHGPGGTRSYHDFEDTFIESRTPATPGPRHGEYHVGTALSVDVDADGRVTRARVWQ